MKLLTPEEITALRHTLNLWHQEVRRKIDHEVREAYTERPFLLETCNIFLRQFISLHDAIFTDNSGSTVRCFAHDTAGELTAQLRYFMEQYEKFFTREGYQKAFFTREETAFIQRIFRWETNPNFDIEDIAGQHSPDRTN